MVVALGCVALIAGVAAACGGDDDDAAGDETVKIGVLAPISGELAPYGEAVERGMEVAVELVNEDGGFGGREVEYVLADDETEPRVAATQSNRLLRDEQVDLLMGTISSATTLAVIPNAEQAQVPYFWIVEGEDKNCDAEGETRKYIFGNGETPEQKMTEFVPLMLDRLGERVFFIGSDYVFPQFVTEITSEMVEENGGTVVGTEFAPLGTTDFSAYLPRIERANPDVIFSMVVGEDGVALVQQIDEFGLRENVEITGIPSFAHEVYPGIADVAQGVYWVDRYWDGLDNPVNEEFVERYQQEFGDDAPVPSVAAQGVYGTVLLFKAAVEEADSVDGDAVAEALPGISVESPAGEITVDPENHIVVQPITLQRITADGYELVEEFGPVSHPEHHGCSSGDI